MAYQSKELGSQKDYERWLNDMGDSIHIVSVSESRKKWSLWTGMANLENAKTITVTYEIVKPQAQ